MMDSHPGDERAKKKPFWLAQYYTPEKRIPMEGPVIEPAGEKYELGENIGAGGMKRVRRALDRNADRQVAMAQLKTGSGISSADARRFLREARITAALEHPNIVPVHDIGIDDSQTTYFTMKLLGGESLHQILRRRREGDAECLRNFPLPRLLEIFLSVCHAVAFAHSRGVLHLDLKPENVQVGSFGEVLVLDWGLARVLPDTTAGMALAAELMEMPEPGVVLGTPDFMAPEQARADHGNLDRRTDIFALGRLLEAMLRTLPHVPRGLLAASAKACAADPADRYVTVEELAAEIRAYRDGFATSAQEASLITQLGLLIKRHRTVASLSGISLILLVAIVSVSMARIRHSERVAVNALAEIQAEQERHRKIGLLAAPRVLEQAEESIRLLRFREALTTLDYAITLDESLTEAWQKKASIHLGRLEFEQAGQAYRQVARSENRPFNPKGMLAEIIEKYAGLSQGTGKLSAEQQRGFVTEIVHADRAPYSHRLLTLTCFFQTQNRSNSNNTDFALIEMALRELNPDARDMVFQHVADGSGLSIALHGSKVSQILPLTGVHITSLDLSNTSVTDLNCIRNAPIAALDLSGTECWEFRCLEGMPTLETLRLLDWKRRDFGRMRLLPQLKTLVVSQRDFDIATQALKQLKQAPRLVVQ